MKNFFDAKNSLHNDYHQLQRQQRATKLQLDSVDFDKRTGRFGKLRVSLERCSCTEFRRNHKPCKHMYRLASELGLFKLDAEKIAAALKTVPRHKLYGCELSISALPPKNFVVVDFEKANLRRDSICQIGIVVVENNCVTDRKKFLVRPPYKNFTATEIHGITFDDVKNKPLFKSLWSQLIKYFDGQTIAAFALPHDLSCLFATLDRYKLPHPKFAAFDVQKNVYMSFKKDSAFKKLRCPSLVTVAEKFGLTHNAHDALSDALVTAQIQIYLSKNFPQKNTTIYFSTAAAVAEGFVKGKIPTEVVVDYCKRILADEKSSACETYIKFLRRVTQAESKHGVWTEKAEILERALKNFKASP